MLQVARAASASSLFDARSIDSTPRATSDRFREDRTTAHGPKPSLALAESGRKSIEICSQLAGAIKLAELATRRTKLRSRDARAAPHRYALWGFPVPPNQIGL